MQILATKIDVYDDNLFNFPGIPAAKLACQAGRAVISLVTNVQGLAILLCALGPDEINEIRTGPLTPYAVRTLRCIKELLGVTFSIKPEGNSETIFLACIGAGIKNVAKGVA